MRGAVYRLTAPLLAKIPDYSGDPPRRQAAIGLTVSVIIHVLILLIFSLGLWLFPKQLGLDRPDQQEALEITIVPPKEQAEPERLTPDEKKAREMLLSRGLQPSEKTDKADFESDQDMKAGSELPASGLLPLPSQEGRTDLPSMDFAKQDVIIGASENAAEAITKAPKGQETPQPIFKPQPVSQVQIDTANEAGPETQLPKVAETPPLRLDERLRPSTPPPLRKVPTPADDELAIATAKPATPAPVAKPLPDVPVAPITRRPMATPAPTQQMASLSTPPPATSQQKKFRDNLEQTRIEGSIEDRGRKGVNAVGTPLARYMKGVSSLVGSRWQILVDSKREWLSVGSVRLKFSIRPDGRIENIVVEANDSNRNFADVCVQAVRDSKLEPLPPEATEQLRDGRLEVPFTFTLYSNH